MNQSMTIAVDLAKDVFEVAVGDARGRIVERARLSRSQFLRFFENRPVAEATSGASASLAMCTCACYLPTARVRYSTVPSNSRRAVNP